jgi:hypothetical protein
MATTTSSVAAGAEPCIRRNGVPRRFSHPTVCVVRKAWVHPMCGVAGGRVGADDRAEPGYRHGRPVVDGHLRGALRPCHPVTLCAGFAVGAASARRWITWWASVHAGPSRALVLRGDAGVARSAHGSALLVRVIRRWQASGRSLRGDPGRPVPRSSGLPRSVRLGVGVSDARCATGARRSGWSRFAHMTSLPRNRQRSPHPRHLSAADKPRPPSLGGGSNPLAEVAGREQLGLLGGLVGSGVADPVGQMPAHRLADGADR